MCVHNSHSPRAARKAPAPEPIRPDFLAHAHVMIFFMAMTLLVGMMNVVVAAAARSARRGVPGANAISLWLTALRRVLVKSRWWWESSRARLDAYPPLRARIRPVSGWIYYLWELQISGIGTIARGFNRVTTSRSCAPPGNGVHAQAGLCWTALCSSMFDRGSFGCYRPVGMLLLTATLVCILHRRWRQFMM